MNHFESNRSTRSLYRRCLKLSLDWAVHRYVWRGQAVYIRSLFEANKSVKEPRQQRVRKTRRKGYQLIHRVSIDSISGNRSLIREMETSRSIPCAHSSGRYDCSSMIISNLCPLIDLKDPNMNGISLHRSWTVRLYALQFN